VITFSPTIAAMLTRQSVEIAYLLDIEGYNLNGTALRKTSFYTNLQMSNDPQGVRIFESDGTIVSIAPPKFDSVVEKSNFDIMISDPDFSAIGPREATLIGNYMEVRGVFVDIDTGIPVLNYTDTLLIYGGRISGYAYATSTKELGENILTLTGGSPVANLDYKKQYFLNKDFVRSRYGDDSCCDQIADGSFVLALKWGKV
jgi:hypothetical protein